MKRSKMIELITDKLYQNDILSPHCDSLSDEILTIVEEAGMSPPLKHPIHHYHLDTIQCLDKQFRQWESENEKN